MHKKNPTKPKQRPQLPLLPTPLSHPWWVPLKIYTDPGTYFARVQAATAKVKSSLTCSCSPINANDTTVKSYGKRSRSQDRKSYLKLELKGDLNVIIILSNQTLWMFALVAISLPRRKMHRWSCSQSHRAQQITEISSGQLEIHCTCSMTLGYCTCDICSNSKLNIYIILIRTANTIDNSEHKSKRKCWECNKQM